VPVVFFERSKYLALIGDCKNLTRGVRNGECARRSVVESFRDFTRATMARVKAA
jgi:hypothetical protein